MHFVGLFDRFRPDVPTIDTRKEIIDIDAHVGIKLALIKDNYIYQRHHYTHRPQPYIGFIL